MSKYRTTFIAATLVCLLPMILSAVLYPELPGQIAIHWDAAGNPDGYASKAVAAYLLPASLAVLNIIVHIVLHNDPKKMNAAPVMRTMGLWFIPVLSLIITPVTLFKAMGADLPIEIIAPALVGMILVVVGNYLPKSRQNYTIGIKLPWTLHSPDNWNKTHRFAGYLWMAGGVLMIIMSFLEVHAVYVILPVILLLALAPTVYSFLLYKRA
ncbi:SdpI family protein [Paenibacillus lemnae]|uniref:SdpI family protein n=1 Tax=Paenibacillus lemnae TaxID=1330551 RepID=A0A848M2J5_PAELE|nr:SdpI family protein [Paenibacillus lemnae]NMO94471.1 SdpI family protein [Paenibacillus lemnae]